MNSAQSRKARRAAHRAFPIGSEVQSKTTLRCAVVVAPVSEAGFHRMTVRYKNNRLGYWIRKDAERMLEQAVPTHFK